MSAAGLLLAVLLVGRAAAEAPYHLPQPDININTAEPQSTPSSAPVSITSSTATPISITSSTPPIPYEQNLLHASTFNHAVNFPLHSSVPALNHGFNQDTSYPLRYSNEYQEPDVYKHVYVHVAPEEPAELQQPVVIPTPKPKKHYKIVFIKAPTALPPAATYLTLPQPDQEKTLIYVLSKKPDLKQQLIVNPAAPTSPTKPEVFFIRYKPNSLPDLQHLQQHQLQHQLLTNNIKPLVNSYGVPLGEPLGLKINKDIIAHNTV